MQQIQLAELQQHFSSEFYQTLSMFGALTPDCRDFLLANGRIWQADSEDVLFQRDDRSDGFYIVLSGAVRFYQPRDEGSDEMVPLRLYNVGEQIGFVSMIGLHQRRGDAIMEEGGYLLEISADLFHSLCVQYPQMFQIFLINIAREMSREITHLDQMCVDGKV